MNSDETLLDTIEAGRFLDVLPRVLEAWRYRHVGPAYIKYNRSRVRYRKSDLVAWLEKRTVVAADD
jgi:hypothetical protein